MVEEDNLSIVIREKTEKKEDQCVSLKEGPDKQIFCLMFSLFLCGSADSHLLRGSYWRKLEEVLG